VAVGLCGARGAARRKRTRLTGGDGLLVAPEPPGWRAGPSSTPQCEAFRALSPRYPSRLLKHILGATGEALITMPTGQWMILIAGPVRSGKSTLAKRLARHFGGMRVGFGDVVRQRTLALGLPGERRFWQQVGEELVARDPDGLVDAVLAPTAGAALVVVDGVRHRRVYDLLRAPADGRRVVSVFVDADVSVRRDRLASDGIDREAIGRVLSHSTEAELPWLRESADIVTYGTSDAGQVIVALSSLIPEDGGQNNR
jgi:cytidylate kinase